MTHSLERGPPGTLNGRGLPRARRSTFFTTVATAAALATLLVCPGSADAGPDKDKKADKSSSATDKHSDGGIDPTNTPLLESDFAAAPSSGGLATDGLLGGGLIATDGLLEFDGLTDAGLADTGLIDDGGVIPTDGMLDYALAPALALDAWDQIQAPAAHQFATGQGVLVAVLDAGWNLAAPALAGHLSPLAFDAIDGDLDPTDLGNGIDDDGDGLVDGGVGHGTFVAGMVLEAAPNATILPIRVRNDEGYGSDAHVIAGIDFALAAGAHVINLSLDGASSKRNGISARISAALEAGVVVVVAAGNDGQQSLQKLAKGEVIAVGAVDAYDCIAPFSNYLTREHSGLMTFAPGVDLFGPLGAPSDDAYGLWSGTSFSAGIASGAAALVLELHPEWDPYAVRDQLGATVDPVHDSAGMILSCAGRLNLLRAVTE